MRTLCGTHCGCRGVRIHDVTWHPVLDAIEDSSIIPSSIMELPCIVWHSEWGLSLNQHLDAKVPERKYLLKKKILKFLIQIPKFEVKTESSSYFDDSPLVQTTGQANLFLAFIKLIHQNLKWKFEIKIWNQNLKLNITIEAKECWEFS